jgi:hypothetical protein
MGEIKSLGSLLSVVWPLSQAGAYKATIFTQIEDEDFSLKSGT